MVIRSGTTALGWVLMFTGVAVVGILLCIFVVLAAGLLGGDAKEAFEDRKILQGSALALSIPVVLGVLGVMAWGLAANTVLKSQSTVVTASHRRAELKVVQRYLVGRDTIHTWKYSDLTHIKFDYVPATDNGETSTPPQGVVYVSGVNRTASQIYSGPACPARSLADAVSSATGLPIDVHAGTRDVTKFSSFLTQIRCGIKHPFRPHSWRQYPAEAWRVLDLPFLWRWPWALPVILAEFGLVTGIVGIIALWRSARLPRLATIAACGITGLAVVALNVFATKSYGSWPAALALFALISGKVASRILKQS